MNVPPTRNRRMIRAQAITGIALASFAFLHLLNATFGLVPNGYDAGQRVFRLYYQSVFVEPLLALCLVLHAGIGISRAWSRRGHDQTPTKRARIMRLAGWFLLFAMAGHVGATRISGLVTGNPVGAEALAFTMEWLPWLFVPYYALLGVAGTTHSALGVGTAVHMLGSRARSLATGAERFGRVWLWVGIPLVVLGVLGIRGTFHPIPDPFGGPYATMIRSLFGAHVDVPSHR